MSLSCVVLYSDLLTRQAPQREHALIVCEEELKIREDEMMKLREDCQRMEEEAWQKEEEAWKKEAEARKEEEEAWQKKVEVRKKEAALRKRLEEGKKLYVEGGIRDLILLLSSTLSLLSNIFHQSLLVLLKSHITLLFKSQLFLLQEPLLEVCLLPLLDHHIGNILLGVGALMHTPLLLRLLPKILQILLHLLLASLNGKKLVICYNTSKSDQAYHHCQI